MTDQISYNYALELDDEYLGERADEIRETVTDRLEAMVNEFLGKDFPVADITFKYMGYPYLGWMWQGKDESELIDSLPEAYADLDNEIREAVNYLVSYKMDDLFAGLV